MPSKDEKKGASEAPKPRGRSAGKAIDEPVKKVSIARESEKEIAQLLTQDAKKTKEILSKQPRVDFIIPLMPGEKVGACETVQINGYKLTIKKGCVVSIPKQVAFILAEHYKISTEAGKDMLVDRPHTPTPEQPIPPSEALA